MWYIVYQNKKGYYVGWQNKGSDKYSENPIEAKKYLSIKPALTRLGFHTNLSDGDWESRDDLAKKIKNYIIKYTRQKDIKRNTILGDILSEPVSLIDLIFASGRIDKLDENGKLIGIAETEVLQFIDESIEKYKKSKAKEIEKYKKFIEKYEINNSYITETKEGEDFWEGFR